MPVRVAHILTADVGASKLDVLGALLDRLREGYAHSLVFCGPDRAAGRGLSGAAGPALERTPALRVTAPFRAAWLAGARLRAALARVRPDVVHLWSPTALFWCAGLPARTTRLLVETDLGDDAARTARWLRAREGAEAIGFVAPTALARRRLIERGVGPERCPVIREFVDFGLIQRGRSADVRGALGLRDTHRVVLALPPVRRGAGHFTALWAALLAQVVREDIRLVVPERSRESRRLRRLALGVRRAHVAHFSGDRFALPELLGAADLVLYLPPADAPVSGLLWAMAAGTPILASATYAVTELLADRFNAWLCRAEDPRAAAGRLLRALESPDESRGLAQAARAQAFESFSRERLTRQYRRVYQNLLDGRPAAHAVEDAARRA